MNENIIKVPKYRIYIDEAGDHTYRDLDYVSHRYLALLGCVFERDNDYKKAAEGMKDIKKKYWPDQDPDRPIIFHREEMVNCKGYFKIFKDGNVRKKFDEDLINYLCGQTFIIINVVLDKKAHMNQYSRPTNPYEYCLKAMLERYCGLLTFHGTFGDVLAESRGGKEDRQIKEVYQDIYTKGTDFRGKEFFQDTLTSREIKIKPKVADISGLQIADILAYPLKEKLFYEKKIRADNFIGNFNEKIYLAVKDKYNRHMFDGRIKGYGEVFIQ